MSWLDRLRKPKHHIPGPGAQPIHIGEAKYDNWEIVREFGDLASGRAWLQLLDENGFDAVLTSDYELDDWERGDVSLRVAPGQWSAANELMDTP